MKIRPSVVAAVALAAVTLSACSSDPAVVSPPSVAQAAVSTAPLSELEALANPKDYQGPTTAVLAHATIEPVGDASQQQLPATVTSYDRSGPREVTVTDASRIVALDIAGTLATTLAGLGLQDSLVGRDSSTELPGTEDLPNLTTDGHTLNPEAVLAVRPTLVITDGSIGPIDGFQQLRDAGIAVVFVEDLDGFDGAEELARQVGAAAGMADAGEALAQRIGEQVAEVKAQIAQMAPSAEEDKLRMVFVYLRGSAGIYYVFGDESGADELIAALGGVDAAADAGIDGLSPLTDEAMVAANPDLILVMTSGLESVGGVDGLLADRPAIALTAAGQHRRIVDMEDREILGFGPRSAAVLDALARAIYAPDARDDA